MIYINISSFVVIEYGRIVTQVIFMLLSVGHIYSARVPKLLIFGFNLLSADCP